MIESTAVEYVLAVRMPARDRTWHQDRCTVAEDIAGTGLVQYLDQAVADTAEATESPSRSAPLQNRFDRSGRKYLHEILGFGHGSLRTIAINVDGIEGLRKWTSIMR